MHSGVSDDNLKDDLFIFQVFTMKKQGLHPNNIKTHVLHGFDIGIQLSSTAPWCLTFLPLIEGANCATANGLAIEQWRAHIQCGVFG